MTVVAFLLILGLVARLTRLLVDDSITQPARTWLARHSDPGGEIRTTVDIEPINNRTRTTLQHWVQYPTRAGHRVAGWLFELLECPWCTSVWVSGAVLAVANSTSQVDLNWFFFCAAWGSLAWLTGLASTAINYLNRD